MPGGPYLALCEAAKRHSLHLELRVKSCLVPVEGRNQVIQGGELERLSLKEPDGTTLASQLIAGSDLDGAAIRLLAVLNPRSASS